MRIEIKTVREHLFADQSRDFEYPCLELWRSRPVSRDARDINIPLIVDRYLLDGWEDGLAADLRSRLADFTGWEHANAKFEVQFERVVRALRTEEGTGAAPVEPKL